MTVELAALIGIAICVGLAAGEFGYSLWKWFDKRL